MSDPGSRGSLYVVATPIGNLEDITRRALRVLGEVDVVCCEDTRRTGQLLSLEGVSAKRLVSLHAHNEASRIGVVLAELDEGRDVALVSDAGTPLVSDPGARLVEACAAAGVDVVAVPGPSAALAALIVSGFSLDRFCFEGFLPRRGAERERRLLSLRESLDTTVCYESPQRIVQLLVDLGAALGVRRRVAICRELTKLHEQVWRGPLSDAVTASVATIAGEYVVVVEGADREPTAPAELGRAVEKLAAAGIGRRDAVAAVEILLDVPHRQAYETALTVYGSPPEVAPERP